ncbi:hypothetical protein LSO9J_20026 [Candidatus Liberibacter solanacearum]
MWDFTLFTLDFTLRHWEIEVQAEGFLPILVSYYPSPFS